MMAMDEHGVSMLMLLGLSGAFDIADHEILLAVLKIVSMGLLLSGSIPSFLGIQRRWYEAIILLSSGH